MITTALSGSSGNIAQVLSDGELTVLIGNFAEVATGIAEIDDTAVNLIAPEAGFDIVITGYVIETNREVGVNGANVEVYAATSASSTAVDTSILLFDMPKQTVREATVALFKVPAGKWVNAKTDDDNAMISIFFYRRPAD